MLKKHFLPNEFKVKNFDTEDLTMEAVVSATVRDREGDIVEIESAQLKKTVDGELDVPLLENHDYRMGSILGSVVSYAKRNGELIFKLKFAKHKQNAIEAYLDIMEGHLKNPFSIGFTYDPTEGQDNILRNVVIHEVSAVVFAANQNSRVLSKQFNRAEALGAQGQPIIKALQAIKDGKEDKDMNLSESQIKALVSMGATEEAITKMEESGMNFDQIVTAIEVKDAGVENEEDDTNKDTSDDTEDTVDVEATVAEAVKNALKEQSEKQEQEEANKVEEARKSNKKTLMSKADTGDFRANFVKGLAAQARLAKGKGSSKDNATVRELQEKAAESHIKTKGVLTAEQFGDSLICDETYKVIEACEAQEDSLLPLVNQVQMDKKSINLLDQSGEFQFTRMENHCDKKPLFEGAVSTELRKKASLSKFAGIAVWCDSDLEDSPLFTFNQITRRIAKANNKLANYIILKDEGGGNEEFASGLLAPANNIEVIETDPLSLSADVLAASVSGSCPLTDMAIIMNDKLYAKLLAANACTDPCKATSNSSTNIGGTRYRSIWGYRVVVRSSEFLADDTAIFGRFKDYDFATRHALRTDISNEATVEVDGKPVYLWQEDKSALRAHTVKGGWVTRPDHFKIFKCAPTAPTAPTTP